MVESLQVRSESAQVHPEMQRKIYLFYLPVLSFRTTFPRGHSGSKLLPVETSAEWSAAEVRAFYATRRASKARRAVSGGMRIRIWTRALPEDAEGKDS